MEDRQPLVKRLESGENSVSRRPETFTQALLSDNIFQKISCLRSEIVWQQLRQPVSVPCCELAFSNKLIRIWSE